MSVAAGVVRGGMALLAAVNLWWGVWARVWPRHFFDEFPGLGHRWAAAYPPFNDHLVTDLGSTFLALAFLLGAAALLKDRRLRVVVLIAVLVFNVSHLAFHMSRPGAMSPFDAGASLATLVGGVLIPAALLAIEALARVPRADTTP